MECQVQEPHLIVEEKYRVTEPGRMLSVATWGTPDEDY